MVAGESRSEPCKGDTNPETIRQLLIEGIFYLYTNARKKELYREMALQVVEMEEALAAKCKDPNPQP